MKHHESGHQQAYFSWARLHPVARLAYAIPNGGARSKVTAAILKAEGVLAGVPDIHLPVARGDCHSLYIEMKWGTNKPSAAQAEVIAHLVEQGHAVVVAYSWMTAKHWTEQYLAGLVEPALAVDKT